MSLLKLTNDLIRGKSHRRVVTEDKSKLDSQDPLVIIAEHFSIGIELPKAIAEPVDLIVFVDRAKTEYEDRKFMVVDVPGEGLVIGAYPTKKDKSKGSEILGRVEVVQIPWLPSMAPTKTGFMEADEYF